MKFKIPEKCKNCNNIFDDEKYCNKGLWDITFDFKINKEIVMKCGEFMPKIK